MRITLQRSGGFANIGIHRDIDTATLSPADRNELTRLITAADLGRAGGKAASASAKTPVADGFQYDLTIEDGAAVRSLRTTDETAPTSLRALIDWLLRHNR